MDTIGRALAAVGQDVQPGSVPDAAFLVAAAEGVLFEGLASLLRQVGLSQRARQNVSGHALGIIMGCCKSTSSPEDVGLLG